jgi:hypothetical protein
MELYRTITLFTSIRDCSFRRRALLALVILFCSARSYAVEEVSVTDEPVVVGHYQFNLGTAVRAVQGTFDPYGQYEAYPDGSKAVAVMTNLGASYRFSKKWEGSISGNIMDSDSTFPTGTMQSTSVSGPLTDVRYHLGYWPHLIIHVGVSPGWHYSSRNSTGNPTASLPDTFGDGTYNGAAAHLGVGGARSIGRFRLAFDFNSIIPFASSRVPSDAPTDSAPVSVRTGDQLVLSQGLAYNLSRKWMLSSSIQEDWGASSTQDGVDVPDTKSRFFSTNLGVSYTPDETWRWLATYSTSYPFYNYAVNGSYAPAVILGMTYAGI